MKTRINITINKNDLQKIDNHVHKKKKKSKTSRSNFIVHSALEKIELDKTRLPGRGRKEDEA